jgi:glycosyltransferase involved in cell wall biosynthesis
VLVGHDASRTGAPMLGLAWARWLLAHHDARIEVRLRRGGPLLPLFSALAPTSAASRAEQTMASALDAGLLPGPARGALQTLERRVHDRGADPDRIVVANTVAAWAAAAELRPRGRLVCWVHELDGVADRVVAPGRRAELLRQTDQFVAEGDRVAEMVCERWGVPTDRVAVVDSFIDHAEHGPATGTRQVIGVGSLVPRKAAESFVDLVAQLHRTDPELRAAWVGGDLHTPYASLVRADIDAAGLTDILELTGSVDDVGPWWPAAGVLVHTAREDPAPLVVVEAAQRGIPVVTWSGGGAGDLLVRAGCEALTVEPGDLLALARTTRELLDDPDRRDAIGRDLRRAAAGRTTEVQGPRLLAAVLGVRA